MEASEKHQNDVKKDKIVSESSLKSHYEILGKEFSPESWQYFNHYISPFVGYWHRLENQEISLVKTIEHLSKATDYLFSKVFML